MATIKVRKKTKLVMDQIPPWNDSIEWHMMTRECNLKKPVPSPVRAKEIPIYRVKWIKPPMGGTGPVFSHMQQKFVRKLASFFFSIAENS